MFVAPTAGYGTLEELFEITTFREDVYELSFAFISPLGTDDDDVFAHK